jgi:hypothetical protein
MRAAGQIKAIYRYPVKGLSPDPLERVSLEAGQCLPFDRAWAIENGPGRFDPSNPRHLPKITFLMLMRNERLAALESRFDEKSTTITIYRGGTAVVSGDLSSRTGRALIEQFLTAYVRADLRGPPRIVSSPGHNFTDTARKCLHIVSLASIRELERVVGRAIDPIRFRPNLVVDFDTAWEELSWVGKEIAVGEARLLVEARTDRCAATNVDPATGARDMDIPAQLARHWGHIDFGIYASVAAPGAIAVGDAVPAPAG